MSEETLIIDGIDWLSHEMLGADCVFQDQFNGSSKDEREGVLYHVSREEPDYPFEDIYGNQYRFCRLAKQPLINRK